MVLASPAIAHSVRALLRAPVSPAAERALRDLLWKHRHVIAAALEQAAAATPRQQEPA